MHAATCHQHKTSMQSAPAPSRISFLYVPNHIQQTSFIKSDSSAVYLSWPKCFTSSILYLKWCLTQSSLFSLSSRFPFSKACLAFSSTFFILFATFLFFYCSSRFFFSYLSSFFFHCPCLSCLLLMKCW